MSATSVSPPSPPTPGGFISVPVWPVLAMMALLTSYGILSDASLSFLGVGDPNVISLGGMLTNGLQYATTVWWVPTFPGVAIFLLVLLLNIVGDGLSIALNPQARQVRAGVPRP